MNQNGPLVSIVLPVHNCERYISKSIDSCLKQAYENIEIIIVNDASNDGTGDILRGYEERFKKIRILNIEKQNSLGAVLNIGIRSSKGKYIARMDADDIMYPIRVEKQVEFLEANEDVVVVGGQIDIIDAEGNITEERKYSLNDKALRRNLFIYQPFAHPAIMFRKNIVLDFGMYPEDLPKVEDVKLAFLFSQKGEFANIPEKVLKYRITFDTESQAKMVDHFKRTCLVREQVIRELGIKPSFREYVLWNLEKVTVFLTKKIPQKWFMGLLNIARRIFK